MKKIPRSTILPQEMGDGDGIIFIPAEEGEEISFFAFLLRNNITPLSTAVSPGVWYARILLLFPYLLKTQENELKKKLSNLPIQSLSTTLEAKKKAFATIFA